MSHSAERILQRIAALARVSEEPHQLTRTYGSPAMRSANDLVATWMREAGMTVREDEIGNLIGRYESSRADSQTFLLGSHLDTVRDAGAYDGPLGVILATECVARLHAERTQLPFAIEVIGFCDEEGARFQTTYLGSRALAGTLTAEDLRRTDANGISLAQAMRDFGGNPDALANARRRADELLGYAEVHIEQGPLLEKKSQPVGIVSAIAGQTRVRVRFVGEAAHAGTTPMPLRRDALVSAAHFIFWVEQLAGRWPGLVATVGRVEVKPNASNVVPGEVLLSLDVRHQSDEIRRGACAKYQELAENTRKQQGIQVEWEIVQQCDSVPCGTELSDALKQAAAMHLAEVEELPSGAGHDAAVMAGLTPMAMLFVRCKGGLSHHPDESASAEDIRVAFAVMNDFLQLLARKHG